MKKIISALVLGAVAAGFAAADISIAANYRNGIDVFKYLNKGDDGRNVDDYDNVYIDSGYAHSDPTYNLFNLTGWNSGKDSVSLKASGDVFNFATTLQPTTGSNNNIVFHIMTIGAEVGNFTFKTGWNGDGVMNYRTKKDADAGNEEGGVFETFKLGSAFTGSDAICVNNQVSFNTGRNFYAQAGYAFVFSDSANMQVSATIMSDRQWDNPSLARWDNNPGWGVFVQPKVKGIFDAEVFAKGYQDKGDKQTLIFGAYGKPLGISRLADGGIGGSVRLYDGKLEEWNVDLRLYFEVNDKLTITTHNKFAKLVRNTDHSKATTDGAGVGTLAKSLTGFNSSQVLWDMVAARYKVNKTVTLIGTVGQLTDLDRGFNNGRDSADGTQVFVHPHAQFYANGKISVVAGVLFAAGGIGADEGANKDVDFLV
ncbi:MAG: hypothetical protein K2J14_03290, partial [Treponemataceae bacterium]|nr:hypothetical protein [Treponemataceae bacterium]